MTQSLILEVLDAVGDGGAIIDVRLEIKAKCHAVLRNLRTLSLRRGNDVSAALYETV